MSFVFDIDTDKWPGVPADPRTAILDAEDQGEIVVVRAPRLPSAAVGLWPSVRDGDGRVVLRVKRRRLRQLAMVAR